MRWFYAVFDAIILVGPLVGSVMLLQGFWQRWRRLLLAWVFVSGSWILMDIQSVRQGWWSFNPEYVSGLKLAGLPIEELLFFIVVPFACAVIYEALRLQVRATVSLRTAHTVLTIIMISLLVVLASHPQQRTFFECFVALVVALVLWRSWLIATRAFWYWNAIILVLCLMFNSLLTGLPVLIYDDAFSSGLRVGTIPIEDLLYNFALLNSFVAVLYGRRPPV